MIADRKASLISRFLSWSANADHDHPTDHHTNDRYEDGFEIAQSMGIALLGLVVAAAFATALQALGVDVINGIRAELGL